MANKSKAADAAKTETVTGDAANADAVTADAAMTGEVLGDAGNDPAQAVGGEPPAEYAMTVQDPLPGVENAGANPELIDPDRFQAFVRGVVNEVVQEALADFLLKLPELVGKIIATHAVTAPLVIHPAAESGPNFDEVMAAKAEHEAAQKREQQRQRRIAREAAERAEQAQRVFESMPDAPVVTLDQLCRDHAVGLFLSDGQRIHPDIRFEAPGTDFASDGGPMRATYAKDIILPGDSADFRLTDVVAVTRLGIAVASLGQDLPFGNGREGKLPGGSLIFRTAEPVAAPEPADAD